MCDWRLRVSLRVRSVHGHYDELCSCPNPTAACCGCTSRSSVAPSSRLRSPAPPASTEAKSPHSSRRARSRRYFRAICLSDRIVMSTLPQVRGFAPLGYCLCLWRRRPIGLRVPEIGVTWYNYHEGDFSFASSLYMMAFDTMLCPRVLRCAPTLSCQRPTVFSTTPVLPRISLAVRAAGACSDARRYRGTRRRRAGRRRWRLDALRKTFSSAHGPVHAVRGVTLELSYGEIACLLGHNGAGKSTTISMLTGLLVPSSGEARVCGHSMTQERARRLGAALECARRRTMCSSAR